MRSWYDFFFKNTLIFLYICVSWDFFSVFFLSVTFNYNMDNYHDVWCNNNLLDSTRHKIYIISAWLFFPHFDNSSFYYYFFKYHVTSQRVILRGLKRTITKKNLCHDMVSPLSKFVTQIDNILMLWLLINAPSKWTRIQIVNLNIYSQLLKEKICC